MLKLILSVLFCGIIALSALNFFTNKKINGNGSIARETRSFTEYDIIHVQGNLDIELIAGKEGEIEIEAEENLIEHVKTIVSGNELNIRIAKGYSLKPSIMKSIIITVPFKDLNEVTLSGSGDINCTDYIKADKFNTSISGSGDINLSVQATSINASVAGSGDLTLNGSSNLLIAELAGSGDISAYELKAVNAEASVAGSGDIKLTVAKDFVANIAGSGDISYQGNPTNIDKHIAGSGNISRQ